jgi:AbrB family looped-hinge helix DNA binding protein
MISKATMKGQVVIPSELRKKYNIKKGSRVSIYEGEGNIIIIKPLPDDPIAASKGMLKGKTSIIKALTRDREEEANRG